MHKHFTKLSKLIILTNTAMKAPKIIDLVV